MASVKVRAMERLFLNGSIGTGLTRGVGAASSRAYFGITSAPGKEPLAIDDAEAIAYKDIRVADHRSLPLRAARVTVGSTTVHTDDEGYALLPSRAVDRQGLLTISCDGFETVELAVEPEQEWFEVKLVRLPVEVAVSVVGPEGVLQLVDVSVTGPYEPEAPRIDDAGVRNWQLRAGTWSVRMSSPGLGTQERTVIIDEDRSDPIRVDAVLAALVNEDTSVLVKVVDKRGRPVEDAVVALGDRDLGTTGTGGDMKVEGLQTGAAQLVVRSERFGDDTVLEVDLEEGSQELTAVLDWLPGSVSVQVLDIAGIPLDARISFSGPADLPTRRLGDDGEEIFVLRPGLWDVRIEADGMGAQRRRLDVSDEPGVLQTIDVVLLREEAGDATLELRVVDPTGEPLSMVDVTLGAQRVGRTGSSGLVVLEGIHPGLRQVSVEGDQLRTVQEEIELISGRQIHTIVLPWLSGVTDFIASDASDMPLNATVTLAGGQALSPFRLGVDGTERRIIPPGSWQVAFSAEGLATVERPLVVEADDVSRAEIRVQLHAPVPETGTVQVEVVDSRGDPIESATVWVDGNVLGDVNDGVAELLELPPGTVELEIQADGMETRTVQVEVTVADEPTAVEVPMDYAEGALEVRVTGPDGAPTEATVTLRGPEHLAPRTTADGEGTVEATPGDWWAVIEAEGMRTQEASSRGSPGALPGGRCTGAALRRRAGSHAARRRDTGGRGGGRCRGACQWRGDRQDEWVWLL